MHHELGPPGATIECFIERDKSTPLYRLFREDDGRFLLSARMFPRAINTEFIITTDLKGASKTSDACVGKLRSNFRHTKFTIFDSEPPPNVASHMSSSSRSTPHVHYGGLYDVGYITHHVEKPGLARMQCTLHSTLASTVINNPGSNDTSTLTQTSWQAAESTSNRLQLEEGLRDLLLSKDDKEEALKLKTKPPVWNKQLKRWTLKFKCSTVIMPSVKNFQLIQDSFPGDEQTKEVLLQFGKNGKDTFSMDYRYPLTAFEAFAICLSKLDPKL